MVYCLFVFFFFPFRICNSISGTFCAVGKRALTSWYLQCELPGSICHVRYVSTSRVLRNIGVAHNDLVKLLVARLIFKRLIFRSACCPESPSSRYACRVRSPSSTCMRIISEVYTQRERGGKIYVASSTTTRCAKCWALHHVRQVHRKRVAQLRSL